MGYEEGILNMYYRTDQDRNHKFNFVTILELKFIKKVLKLETANNIVNYCVGQNLIGDFKTWF